MKTSLAIASFLILLFLAPASTPAPNNNNNHNHRRREQTAACSSVELWDVIIIGAGMSGLAAANWLLAKTNYCIKVIEAQDRVGGKMKSAIWDGQLVELGGTWISGGTNQPIKTLADNLGGTPYFAMDFASIDFYDTTRPVSNRKLRDQDWQPRARDHDQALTLMESEAEALYEDYYTDTTVQLTDRSALDSLADQNQKSWVPMTPVDRAIEHWYFQADYIYGTERLSLHNFPDDTYFDFGNVDYHVKGTNINNGIEGLANKFRNYFDPVGQIVRTGEPVTTITYNASRAIVTTNTATYTARKVILATGIEALQRMANSITPRIQYLDRFPLKLGVEIKVYLKFDTLFWDTNKQFILIATNKTATSTLRGICNFYLNYDFAQLKPGSKLLACYIDQDTLDSYYMTNGKNLTEAEAMDEAGPILKPLKDSFTGVFAPSQVLITNWANEEYVWGSWEVWDIDPRRNLTDYYTFIDQPLPGSGQERTLILAGCHACIRYWGSMHGAYYAGTKGAKYAIQSLNATGTSEARPYSPCDDPDVINGAEFEDVPPMTPPVAAPVTVPVATPVVPPLAPPVAAPKSPPVAPPVVTPVAAPMSPPVAVPRSPPVTPPITAPVASPVAVPKSPPVTPPVASPVVPPVAVPKSSPVTPPITAPVASPVAVPKSPPVTPPVASPVVPPVAVPKSSPVTPPITAPVAPPVAVPKSPPVSPPIASPVAPPVTPPITAPVASPVAVPKSPPVSPPVASPVAPPVTPPITAPAPVASPVAAPFSPPVSPPIAAPVFTPVAAPKSSPVSPPVATPVVPPLAVPKSSPVTQPVASPVVVPKSPPVTPPITAPVAPPAAAPISPVVSPPIITPLAPPVAAPISLVVPPVAAPKSPPVTPPITAPVAPPVAAPKSPPVTPPITTPLVPPVAAPKSSPVTPPITAPVASPVAVPRSPPVTPPFTAPLSSPVAAPVSPPAIPPVAVPVEPPVEPPVLLVDAPGTPAQDPPVAAPETPSIETPVDPTTTQSCSDWFFLLWPLCWVINFIISLFSVIGLA